MRTVAPQEASEAVDSVRTNMMSPDQREIERLRALNQTLVGQLERMALRVLSLEDELQVARSRDRGMWTMPLGRVVEEHERTEAALREWSEECAPDALPANGSPAFELKRRGLWREPTLQLAAR